MKGKCILPVWEKKWFLNIQTDCTKSMTLLISFLPSFCPFHCIARNVCSTKFFLSHLNCWHCVMVFSNWGPHNSRGSNHNFKLINYIHHNNIKFLSYWFLSVRLIYIKKSWRCSWNSWTCNCFFLLDVKQLKFLTQLFFFLKWNVLWFSRRNYSQILSIRNVFTLKYTPIQQNILYLPKTKLWMSLNKTVKTIIEIYAIF